MKINLFLLTFTNNLCKTNYDTNGLWGYYKTVCEECQVWDMKNKQVNNGWIQEFRSGNDFPLVLKGRAYLFINSACTKEWIERTTYTVCFVFLGIGKDFRQGGTILLKHLSRIDIEVIAEKIIKACLL